MGQVPFLFSFGYVYPVVPTPFAEKTILSSLSCFCTLIKNQVAISVSVCFLNLFSVPLIYIVYPFANNNNNNNNNN